MTTETGPNNTWLRAATAALAFVALGATGTYVYMRRSMTTTKTSETSVVPSPAKAARSATPAQGPLRDVTITLTPEAARRAGITVVPVQGGSEAWVLRLPGIVEPNAYRQVVVTPLVAGRVTGVAVSLGDRVARGQTLAQIHSSELADAQSRYLRTSAELEAARQRLLRTERLVEIGAASTQELETIRAEHAAQSTELEGARAKLTLLGLGADRIERLRTAADVTATVAVPAPLAGVVTERSVNVGLNVDPSTPLLKVVDLSTVWVVADLYERDFARVKIGSPVTVTTAAYPGPTLPGKVNYVDPQVDPTSRTAKVRIEIMNRGQQLRLGMYADVAVSGPASTEGFLVPRSAVHTVGDRQVVYLADPKQAGKFVEREVRLGEGTAEGIRVISGLAAGDTVVTEGSFSLRAERDRLGLSSDGAAMTAPPATSSSGPATALQEATVTVGDTAFEPATLTFRAGIPARVTFVRTSEKTCATEVVFPSLNLRKALPLNEPVAVEFVPEQTGEVAFACGMNMLKGRAVVEAR